VPDAIDYQLKRLDHLQGIVQRLAGNSFLIKGWAITLATAILGFAVKDPGTTARLAFLAVVPTLIFWGLDAYYLAVERGMRNLYNTSGRTLATAHYNAAANNLPTADIVPESIGFCGWFCGAIVPATSTLYLVLLAALCVVGFGLFTRTVAALITV